MLLFSAGSEITLREIRPLKCLSAWRVIMDFLLPNQKPIQPTFKEISMIRISLF
jgi:hypothetical protein